MKKLFLLIILVIVSIAIGYSMRPKKDSANSNQMLSTQKREILSFALVADSENENDLLAKALKQAQGMGINFVVGLGDWTQVGTVAELEGVKKVFDASKIQYFLTPGDHDLWDSRNRKEEAIADYKKVFGEPNAIIVKNNVEIILVDNSDIYKGISSETWEFLNSKLQIPNSKLTFVAAHKTPFHPESSHIMGAETPTVASQAKILLDTLISSNVSGFFSGDIHFFAQFKSPDGKLPITTVGAIASTKNFQGPRFAVVKVYSDYSWEVSDVEIR